MAWLILWYEYSYQTYTETAVIKGNVEYTNVLHLFVVQQQCICLSYTSAAWEIRSFYLITEEKKCFCLVILIYHISL